jgi:tRNA 2-thiouridine synthesizing protein B
MANAVYGAVRNTASTIPLNLLTDRQIRLFALSPDLEARGFGAADVLEKVQLVDYAGFVELTVSHRLTQSWF